MLSKSNQAQLCRIASFIGGIFGVVDESGAILYSNSELHPVGSSLIMPEILTVAAEKKLHFFEGYYFYAFSADDDEALFFFLKTQSESDDVRKLLSLASYAFEFQKTQYEKHFAEFLRRLLEGDKGISKEEMDSLYEEMPAGVRGYTVILVDIGKEREGAQFRPGGEHSLAAEALQGVFPREHGFFVVSADGRNIAVICPLTEEQSYEYIVECGELVRDTLMSEVMVDAYVSVGSAVTSLQQLKEAYQEAVRTRDIGMMFELEDKCYVYNRLGVAKVVSSLSGEICAAFLKETLGESFLQDKFAPELLTTIKVFLQKNQNVSEASRALYIHRNTMMYRLDKFQKMTGLDCAKFEAGMKVGLALLILQYAEKSMPDILR